MTTYKQRLDELVNRSKKFVPSESIGAWHFKEAITLAEELHADLEWQKESVRCMSKVFDDLADELGVPKEKHGDPDLLFDAIDQLRKFYPPTSKPEGVLMTNEAQMREQLRLKIAGTIVSHKVGEATLSPLEDATWLMGEVDKYTRHTATEQMMPLVGWQPIETAPHKLEFRCLAAHAYSTVIVYYDGSGWVNERSISDDYFPATHWMPLPPLPTTIEQEQNHD